MRRGWVFPRWAGVLLAAAGEWVPFEKDGKWGYRNRQGRVVIAPRFRLARRFTPEGIAAVVDAGGWAYIDRTGKRLLRPFVFDNGPDYFREGLARFVRRGRFGFFDRRGRVAIRAVFDFAAPFSEGRAAVCRGCRRVRRGEHAFWEGGKWGFIDRTGRVVIPVRFDAARPFRNGKARVRLGHEWREITCSGALLPSGRAP